MQWDVALAWVEALYWGRDLLGIWRAQRGPGPWSIFLRRDGRLLEIWASPTGELFGKRVS